MLSERQHTFFVYVCFGAVVRSYGLYRGLHCCVTIYDQFTRVPTLMEKSSDFKMFFFQAWKSPGKKILKDLEKSWKCYVHLG